MILAFAHPGLVVPDLDRAREFYERMFGFRVISDEGWTNEPAIDRAIGSSGSASRGHLMAGVLVEGRYRIEEVRQRTVVRSEVLETLLGALQKNGIPMASQPVRITQG